MIRRMAFIPKAGVNSVFRVGAAYTANGYHNRLHKPLIPIFKYRVITLAAPQITSESL